MANNPFTPEVLDFITSKTKEMKEDGYSEEEVGKYVVQFTNEVTKGKKTLSDFSEDFSEVADTKKYEELLKDTDWKEKKRLEAKRWKYVLEAKNKGLVETSAQARQEEAKKVMTQARNYHQEQAKEKQEQLEKARLGKKEPDNSRLQDMSRLIPRPKINVDWFRNDFR